MATRRGVLKLIGGGVVVAAAAGTGVVVAAQPSSSAREPWRSAGSPSEYRRRALSYALLAPNPHNRQPWLVRLEGRDALSLYLDLDKRLPATDPFDRQLVLGCGTFLETLSIAAAQDGYATKITAFPEGDPRPRLDKRPVAHVEFTPRAATPDPAFAYVQARRTNREVYEPRDVAPPALVALAAAGTGQGATAHAIGNTPDAAFLRDLTWRAHSIESTTRATWMESVNLVRIGPREVAANADGLAFDAPMLSALGMAGLVTRAQLADMTSTAFTSGMSMFEKCAASARAFAWITNDGTTRASQIAAGRAYARMALKATELGLAIHPWSQALQEYPEMASLYRQVHDRIGGGQRLQMLVRVGYAPSVEPAPRWPLAEHMIV